MYRFTIKLLPVLLCLVLVSCGGAQMGIEPGGDAVEATAVAQPTLTTPDARFDCGAVTEIPTAECQALVSFYDATGGPRWQDNSGWLATNTPCSWNGASCADGHVDRLGLFFNNLQGPLPTALADLAQLRALDLHNNSISGPIPAEIGRLAGLQSLDLSANQLTGPLPATLGNLPALQFLHLAYNQLSGPIPAEFGQMTALTTVDLSHNQLSGVIPATFGNLTALQTVRLNDNQLEGPIPFELGQLPALTEVDLAFNQLTGAAPSALFQVTIHRLWGNQLDGTIFAENGQQSVNFLGAAFTYDRAMADHVWAEQMSAHPAESGPGVMWAPSEYIVFTLTRADGPQNHNPMGLYGAAEAQIHIYPTAGLNAEVQPTVDNLRQLLAERPDPADYAAVMPEQDAAQPGLAMLPPSNAVQMFRAHVAYLTFIGGQGVRYLTQLSQGPIPANNQDLFYTFQGLTDDGAFYIAAYFPVMLPALPETPQLSEDEYATLMADWQGYVAQTVDLLNRQPTATFTPDLATLDAVINSLSLAGLTAAPELEGVWPDNGESVDNQPILQWAAFPGAVRYELVVVDDDAFPPVVAFSQFTTDTVMPVTPALDPGSYSWTVRALDANDALLGELNRQFLVRAAIEVIGPVSGAAVNATPTLTWRPYPGAAGYQLILLDDDAFPPVVVVDMETADTTFTVTTPLESGSYSWTVWAKDANGVVVAELVNQFIVED